MRSRGFSSGRALNTNVIRNVLDRIPSGSVRIGVECPKLDAMIARGQGGQHDPESICGARVERPRFHDRGRPSGEIETGLWRNPGPLEIGDSDPVDLDHEMDVAIIVLCGLCAYLLAGAGLPWHRRDDGIDDREEDETPCRNDAGPVDPGRAEPAREVPDWSVLIDPTQTPVIIPDRALICGHGEGPLPPVLRVPGEVLACDEAARRER